VTVLKFSKVSYTVNSYRTFTSKSTYENFSNGTGSCQRQNFSKVSTAVIVRGKLTEILKRNKIPKKNIRICLLWEIPHVKLSSALTFESATSKILKSQRATQFYTRKFSILYAEILLVKNTCISYRNFVTFENFREFTMTCENLSKRRIVPTRKFSSFSAAVIVHSKLSSELIFGNFIHMCICVYM